MATTDIKPKAKPTATTKASTTPNRKVSAAAKLHAARTRYYRNKTASDIERQNAASKAKTSEHRAKRRADTEYQRQIGQAKASTYSAKRAADIEYVYAGGQVQRQYQNRQLRNRVVGSVVSPSTGGGSKSHVSTTGLVAGVGIGSLVLILAYVSFVHPGNASAVITDIQNFFVNLASEKPLFQASPTNGGSSSSSGGLPYIPSTAGPGPATGQYTLSNPAPGH